jgi:hypothetical protein
MCVLLPYPPNNLIDWGGVRSCISSVMKNGGLLEYIGGSSQSVLFLVSRFVMLFVVCRMCVRQHMLV